MMMARWRGTARVSGMLRVALENIGIPPTEFPMT